MAVPLKQRWDLAWGQFSTTLQRIEGPTEDLKMLEGKYNVLKNIYQQAVGFQATLAPKTSNNFRKLMVVSLVGSVVFGLGFAGEFLSRADIGKGWLGIAVPACFAVAHGVSKVSDFLSHRRDQEAAFLKDLTSIIAQEALLKLAGQLVGVTNSQGRAIVPADDLSGVQWKKVKQFCLDVVKDRSTETLIEIDGGGVTSPTEKDHLVPFSRQNSGDDSVPWQ